jgi:hypothetical protein
LPRETKLFYNFTFQKWVLVIYAGVQDSDCKPASVISLVGLKAPQLASSNQLSRFMQSWWERLVGKYTFNSWVGAESVNTCAIHSCSGDALARLDRREALCSGPGEGLTKVPCWRAESRRRRHVVRRWTLNLDYYVDVAFPIKQIANCRINLIKR